MLFYILLLGAFCESAVSFVLYDIVKFMKSSVATSMDKTEILLHVISGMETSRL